MQDERLKAATGAFLRYTNLGTAMRALASDREITATLGVPVRRVEAVAWFGSGLACGAAGLLLPDLLTSLDYSALTFLVIGLIAALMGFGLTRDEAERALERCAGNLRAAIEGSVDAHR